MYMIQETTSIMEPNAATQLRRVVLLNEISNSGII